MASPEPAPRHIGSIVVGGALIVVIAVELILAYMAWFS
jgi:hypothetical protein